MNLGSALYFIFVFYTICNKAPVNIWADKYAMVAILIALVLELYCLMLFFTQLKRIEIAHNSISFTNPLIPGMRTTAS